MPERLFIYRFTKDLRLDDHAGLAQAAQHGSVLPLLVIDAAMQARMKASPRRAAFFCAAVEALDGELRERGSRLIVRRAEAAPAVVGLAREMKAGGAAWSASYDCDGMKADRHLQSELEARGLVAGIAHDAPAVPPEKIGAKYSAQGSGYRAFGPYFDAWWQLPTTSYEYPLLLRFAVADVTCEPLPSASEFRADGNAVRSGASAAQAIFAQFLRKDAPQYAAVGNLPAADRTSHLGAHLSFGTISARSIVRAIRTRLADPFALSEERWSLRLFLRALSRRDFFLQLAWFYPSIADEPLQEKMRSFAWAQTHPALDAWKEGRTGYPFVDAGVRQLEATGWMHPHVRAVAASWLCFDLGVDWRIGRAHWDRWLTEDDLALATGNWQWIAGVGADMAQYPRIYNPERQRRRYDPAGIYVRRWISELRGVPLEAWYGHSADSPQLALSLYDSPGYPQSIVDHAVAARAFLRRYRDFIAAG